MEPKDALVDVLVQSDVAEPVARRIARILRQYPATLPDPDDLAGGLLRWRARAVAQGVIDERMEHCRQMAEREAAKQLTFADVPWNG